MRTSAVQLEMICLLIRATDVVSMVIVFVYKVQTKGLVDLITVLEEIWHLKRQQCQKLRRKLLSRRDRRLRIKVPQQLELTDTPRPQ